ncbi:MAG TPA: hypothetical protein VJL81_03135 [Solirubrobacterales bacterium]|nr:hypothetical protein [Solirubrobacterales bacterium]
MPGRSLIAIVTPAFGSRESIEALKREAADGDGAEVRLVAPAIEHNPLHHTLGDVDLPREEAQKRLEEALAAAKAGGLPIAKAEVGDPDPVQAAQDALLEKDADEILIFCHADDGKEWYEGGLWKHAADALEPPLKLVVVDGGPDSKEHVVDTETAARGYAKTEHEVGAAYLPGLTRGELAAMTFGIVGTIVVVILAAVAAAGGTATGWRAVAIGIAIAVALVNMADVVGTLLMESVRYRGGFAKLFRDISMIATPIAIVVNALIVILA